MILILLSCLKFESLPTSGLIRSSLLLHVLKEMTKATVICHQSLRSSFLLSPCRLSVLNLVVLGMVYSLVSIFILTVSVIPRSSIFSSLSCIACIYLQDFFGFQRSDTSYDVSSWNLITFIGLNNKDRWNFPVSTNYIDRVFLNIVLGPQWHFFSMRFTFTKFFSNTGKILLTVSMKYCHRIWFHNQFLGRSYNCWGV